MAIRAAGQNKEASLSSVAPHSVTLGVMRNQMELQRKLPKAGINV